MRQVKGRREERRGEGEGEGEEMRRKSFPAKTNGRKNDCRRVAE